VELFVNGEIKETNFATLNEWLIAEFGNSFGKGFAVAVNEAVVPNSEWGAISLHKNDRILIVQATQGG
jgi:sulfur carrier protein